MKVERGDRTIAAVDIDNTLDITMQAAFRFRFSEDHLLTSFSAIGSNCGGVVHFSG
jgi:hypothetical protein